MTLLPEVLIGEHEAPDREVAMEAVSHRHVAAINHDQPQTLRLGLGSWAHSVRGA